MLQLPAYLRESKLATSAIDFEWDEWQVKKYYIDFSDADFDRLADLSGRAKAALAYASGEWILQRFSTLNADPIPYQYIEACWAANVHPAYFPYVELIDDEWRGPVRSPLRMMMAIAGDVYFAIDDDPDLQGRSLWMRNLARHVLPHDCNYNDWFEQSLARLMAYHRQGMQPDIDGMFTDLPDDMGTPIPRVLFDLSQPYDPSQDAAQVDYFMHQLDHDGNPFLAPPNQLATFEELNGKAYRYIP